MIFVTVGSQKFQFNRLLRAIDELSIDEEIFAQIGYSDYEPKNIKYKRFLNKDEFDEMIDRADIVITHGGTGVIVNALKKEKKVIGIPRKSQYKEHVDDHQIQIINELKKKHYIIGLENCDDLIGAINKCRSVGFVRYKSNTLAVIEDIDKFVEGI